MTYRKLLIGILITAGIGSFIPAKTEEKKFIISFGNGGFKEYEIIDNTCFGYVMGYPNTDKTIPNILNEALMRSLKQAKDAYEKKSDGYINVRVKWQFIGTKRIIYQVCGDIVRRK
ncbi:hypothetical protein [Persephonella sp.]